MLQALGSSTNAKIAYIMFGGCCILIIGTFIFVANFEKITFDNSYAYCATAYFSPKTGYRVEYWGQRNDFDKIDTGCARACYKEQKNDIGLSFLEIETQTGYADHNQAYAAGILEGTLTWMSIYAQWKNTIQSFCERDDTTAKFCTWLRAIIERNHDNIMSIAKEKHSKSQYQHQIYLFYQQLYGIERGFKQGVKRARKDFEIETVDFLLLNARVDIEDLKIYYNKYVEEDEGNFMEIYENAEKMIIDLVHQGDVAKVNIGHSSDGEYSSMLKVVKTYRFNYHQGTDFSNHLVANTDITFTSYPGLIASTDDFYLAHGKHTRMIIAGIKLKYEQPTQIHGIDLDSAVLMSVRVMAANRLAKDGKSWAKYLARDPDIGAKQWLVIDEKRLKYLKIGDHDDDEEIVTSSSTLDDGLMEKNEIPLDNIVMTEKEKLETLTDAVNSRNIIWLVENTWKRLHGEDVTARLKKDTAWICDGTPYYKIIQELNKIDGKDIRLNEQQMNNVDDIVSKLRQHAYRGDLRRSSDGELIAYGNTDIKTYSSLDRTFSIQSGPVISSIPEIQVSDEARAESLVKIDVFEWKQFEDKDISHDEQPEAWNFPTVHVQYIWN